MGITIIRREGQADRKRRIYDEAQRNPRYRQPLEGLTKSVDEAHDIAYHQHGEQAQPYLVEGDVPEMRQAHEDNLLRVGKKWGHDVDPDREYRRWQEQEAERKK